MSCRVVLIHYHVLITSIGRLVWELVRRINVFFYITPILVATCSVLLHSVIKQLKSSPLRAIFVFSFVRWQFFTVNKQSTVYYINTILTVNSLLKEATNQGISWFVSDNSFRVL